MQSKEDGIPLVAVKPNVAQYCRTTSCFGEPEANALRCFRDNDLTSFSTLLANVCPVGDDEKPSKEFPLAPNHWVNTPYGKDGQFKTLLHLALEEKKLSFAKVLLSAGARADAYNEILGVAPIHVAVTAGDIEAVKLLLAHKYNKANVNAADKNGSTPLHIAAEKNDIAILALLLDRDDLEDVDPENLIGRQTPLYLAAKHHHGEAVKMLLQNDASPLNVCFGKSIGKLIEAEMPYFDVSKVPVIKKRDRSDAKAYSYSLNYLLDRAASNQIKGLSNAQIVVKFNTLLQRLNRHEIDTAKCEGTDKGLFQKACDYGLVDFVEALLNNDADPNRVVDECSTRPLLLAAHKGYAEVIEKLKEHKLNAKDGVRTVCFSVVDSVNEESVLHHVLKRSAQDLGSDNQDYDRCLKVLLSDNDPPVIGEELRKIINHKDKQQNTALHYATQSWSQEVVRKLLERGANIGQKNLWDERPISKILPETMESFLDEHCLQSENEVNTEDFKMTFNFSFLAPPTNHPIYDEMSIEGQEMVEKAALPETDTLWYMSQSKEHRHLLRHPVIATFLWLKWQKIQGYFNKNLRFYLLFSVCLTWYIFERYGGITSRTTITNPNSTFCDELSYRQHPSHVGFWFYIFLVHAVVQFVFIFRDFALGVQNCECRLRTCLHMTLSTWMELSIIAIIVIVLIFSTKSLWTVLTILTGFLMLREIFQMSVSLKRYFCTPENWMELVMLIWVGVILWEPDARMTSPCEIKRHLAAVSIILSWAELITLVARHPKLSRYNVYVTMFYKVLSTFLFFLIWYSIFIIAFGMGFYIMLHMDVPNHNVDGDEYKFFNWPWLSLIKTSTMFVGELEFGDLPIKDGFMSPVSYIFLLTFVFLIVVVLMNLLNGLAVSDTGIIRDKAEIVSYISRVETISYTESLLLGDPFDFLSNWPHWLRNFPSLACSRCMYQNRAIRDVSHTITGATGILLFYSTLPPSKKYSVEPNKRRDICDVCGSPRINAEVVRSAKQIILKRRRTNADDDRIEKMEEKIKEVDEKLILILEALKINHG